MKIKTLALGCLIMFILCCIGYEASRADSASGFDNTKIGVVSIRKIFQECKANADYRQKATMEQEKTLSELDKLSKEIEAQQAGLKTLKSGTPEYMELVKKLLNKQGELQAGREFGKQQFALKDQNWTTKLYKQILQITEKIAQERGLNLVLEKDESETIDSSTANELMLTIRTHKVLYSEGCLDITGEVMARLDANG